MPDLSTVVNMFFGADNNKVLYALIILVTLDYITGVCVAIKDKKLSSSIGAKGIINKVARKKRGPMSSLFSNLLRLIC